jgi:DNA-binding winged helix-turn-helix (wHTH) protein
MTHRALLTAVWGAQSAHQPEYLRVFVGQLRKKLEAETGKQYIQTEPWVGYRFIPEGWSGGNEECLRPAISHYGQNSGIAMIAALIGHAVFHSLRKWL